MKSISRYALSPTQYAMTLDEVAAALGVTHAYIWQLEQRALRKIARQPRILAEFKALIELRESLRGDNLLRLSSQQPGGAA